MSSNADHLPFVFRFSLHLLLTILFSAAIFGCSPAPVEQVSLIANTAAPTFTSTVTSTAAALTPTPTSTPLPTNTPMKQFPLCSPLDTYTIDQLLNMISNPYYPPELGSDDPHQGIDLTEVLPDSQIAIAGERVNALLSGTVAGVIEDRFPYGNTVIIEVPLDDLPPAWTEKLNLPAPYEGELPNTSLSCPPQAADHSQPASGEQSLYLLYAHLTDPPAFELDDWIQCGWELGAVGLSGNALNPHLHLEVRVGPAGARFDSMAHYIANATNEEMANYCDWRVGGQYQVIDPLLLFSLEQ